MTGTFCLLKMAITADEFYRSISQDSLQPIKNLEYPDNVIFAKPASFLFMFYIEINGDEHYRIIVPAADGQILVKMAETLPAYQIISILDALGNAG